MGPHQPLPAPSWPRGWDVLVRHYDELLKRHGPTPRGVDWPDAIDLAARFGVALELLAEAGPRARLLDLGCGPALLLDYLAATGHLPAVRYLGVDLSPSMIDAARARWPDQEFLCRDIVTAPLPEQSVDVVLMNGILTERVSLEVETMKRLGQSLIAAAFRAARVGVAFNVMSAHVDWERDDLFHWGFDDLAAFLRPISRHYTFRADYGLHEYTCFVWRHARRPPVPAADGWWNG